MKKANGIEMLELPVNLMGRQSSVNPALIWDDECVILADTGFPGQLPLVKKAVEEAGISFEKINKVILTHQDIDHVGNLSGIVKELSGKVEVLAHKAEIPYIDGTKAPIKLAKLEAGLEQLTPEMRGLYEKMKAGFESCKASVDTALNDREELPWCGGIIVIHTPGHTPGHICLYHKQSKTLIAGDALKIENGILLRGSESTNFDNELSRESLKQLMDFDIQKVICYHGGLFTGNISKRLEELKTSSPSK